jgi:regulator-associated protein of mTOR
VRRPARAQPRARYKQSLDPTVEDVKKLCDSLRRSAKVPLPPRLQALPCGSWVLSGNVHPFSYTFIKSLSLSLSIFQDERVLFHYNGHGVPKPTPNSEIWVFNKSFTQVRPAYPLSKKRLTTS